MQYIILSATGTGWWYIYLFVFFRVGRGYCVPWKWRGIGHWEHHDQTIPSAREWRLKANVQWRDLGASSTCAAARIWYRRHEKIIVILKTANGTCASYFYDPNKSNKTLQHRNNPIGKFNYNIQGQGTRKSESKPFFSPKQFPFVQLMLSVKEFNSRSLWKDQAFRFETAVMASGQSAQKEKWNNKRCNKEE